MSFKASNQRQLPNNLVPGVGTLSKSFDHAAYHFYVRYKEETFSVNLRDFLARLERAVIFITLANTNGSQKDTARLLKLKVTTLNTKIKKLNISIVKVPKVNAAVNEPGVENS